MAKKPPTKNREPMNWKSIPEYDGMYEVSDCGKVKSLKRKHWMKRNNCFREIKERILTQSIDGMGYFNVGLTKLGKTKTRTVHQLVAEAFLGYIPAGHKVHINHINNIKTDNRVENLEIVSGRENTNRKHLKSTSKYVGVSWNKSSNKWVSQIRIKGKGKHLGYFTDEYEAHQAYQEKLNLIK